jgi:uncharacterized membrane protein
MTAFTVWKFETVEGAGEAADMLARAADEDLITVEDVAVVTWPPGEKEPTVQHGTSPTKRGAKWGAVGGLVLGAAFTLPLLGAASGAVVGAAANKYRSAGIADDQLAKIREGIGEGDSVLLALTEGGDLDRVGERFRGMSWKLIDTNLTQAERESLYETFGGK